MEVIGFFLLAVFAVVVLLFVWTSKRRPVLICPDREAEKLAAMNALWPLPSGGF